MWRHFGSCLITTAGVLLFGACASSAERPETSVEVASSPPFLGIAPGITGPTLPPGVSLLAPGVVTLARLRPPVAPTGQPSLVTVTGHLTRYRSRTSLCLYENQVNGRPGHLFGGSEGGCWGLPIAKRDLPTFATTGWCTPAPVEFAWGLTQPGTRTLLISARTQRPTKQTRLPTSLKVSADLYYGFVRGAPVRVLARSTSGQVVADKLVNRQAVPYGCDHHIGPGPGAGASP